MTENDILIFKLCFPVPGRVYNKKSGNCWKRKRERKGEGSRFSLTDKLSSDKLHNETVTRLIEMLREMCSNAVLTEDFLLLSSVINTSIDST